MDELKEIIGIVSRNKTKRIDIIGNPANYSSQLQRLYDGIAEGRLRSDEEAVELLYKGNDKGSDKSSDKSSGNYRRLKRRLHERLINSLFFIDLNQPNFTETQRAYYNCYKDFAALKILMGRSAIKAAFPLAEKILKKAIRFEFTDLAVNVLRELRILSATFEGNQKKFKEYNALFHQQYELFAAELMAEEYYEHLVIHFVKSKATKSELEETACLYSEKLRQFEGKLHSQRFILFSYLVFTLRYQIVNDYRNTLKMCEEAVRMLEKKGNLVPKNNFLIFWVRIASCRIQLGEYEKGEEALTRCLELTEEGIYNWYTIKELHLILLYRSGQFQKAFDIFADATARQGFKNLPEAYREQWFVHEAFIHYFISIHKINPGLKDADASGKFRLAKFLNEVPVFSQDKRGTNISILIIQVLFLIQQKRHEEVNDRLNALQAYSHRYLRKNDTFRSNCFIHMLMQVPQAYFNRKAVIRKANRFVEKLCEAPLAEANQGSELELVPYEVLWEFVLASLKG